VTEPKAKVVAITGGGSGVGLHTARHFASLGWQVSICGRNRKVVEGEASRLEQDFGIRSFGCCADVSSQEEIIDYAKKSTGILGPIDTLICNAAILGPIGRLADIDILEIEQTFKTNVIGVYNSVKGFWEQLSNSQSPRVITISGGGTGGPNPVRKALAYVPSKAAIAAFTEIISDELRALNGSIVSVALGGAIPTNFLHNVISSGIDIAGKQLFDDAMLQQSGKIGDSLNDFYSLLDFLMTESGVNFNGKMLSARWNKVSDLEVRVNDAIDVNLYQLRRIDGHLYMNR
jgi:NAD(P)-dependent dehydrogenase (short-subunit alcohol dehydrogenase family)